VFQVHQVVKSRHVVVKSITNIQKKVSALQDPEEVTVYRALHCLADTTRKAVGPVTTCEGAIFARFQN
jgi:hypothetical protein